MKEFILCSAIKFNGFPVCGRRHSDCFKAIHFLVGDEAKYVFDKLDHDIREDQGFLTSTNRFVDRREAWKIALNANQIQYGLKASDNGEKSELISENLYGCD